jgi:ABC-type glycerol-3-phosphate transport system permease component
VIRFLVPESFLAESSGMPRSKLSRRRLNMRKLITLAPIAALLTACEDAGNSGNDNLLTGGSLVLIVIIVIVVVLLRRRG